MIAGKHNRLGAIICLFIVVVISISVCGPKTPQHITILYTNDIHGHFLPEPASWLENKPLIGGFKTLDYYVEQVREEKSNILLLDAGDLMTGNVICNMEYEGADGGALIEMMNLIGYDGMTCGNHEFDKPKSNFLNLAEIADFPVICANLLDSSGNSLTGIDYHIYNISGLKIGVIGVTAHPLAGLISLKNIEGYNSYSPVPVIATIVGEIDKSTDLIVILSHSGIELDRGIAEKVENIDVIIGGHNHLKLEQPELVNGVLILQAGSKTNYLGKLDLTVAGDSVMNYNGELIPLFSENTVADNLLAGLVDSFAQVIDQEYGRVIGHLKTDWVQSSVEESNMGNWLTDAMRLRADTDVGFINSGAIRKSLPDGPVTVKDVLEIIPFLDYVEIFECSGEQLITIIRNNAEAQATGSREILQVSGLQYSWKMIEDKVSIIKAEVGNELLEPDKTYKVSSLDYVINKHGKYFGFRPQNVVTTDLIIYDLLVEAVEEAGEIISSIEGRIEKVR